MLRRQAHPPRSLLEFHGARDRGTVSRVGEHGPFERDRAHAYPTLEDHGDLGLGIVHRQGRVERIPGDGALVKPATATFVGTRVEGGGAVRTTVVAIAILAALEFVIFFGGGGD